MKIEQSLEWAPLKDELMSQIKTLSYNPDIRRMITNIDKMVVELSKAEVEARRTKRPYTVQKYLDHINESLETIDKFITLAHLVQ